MRILSWFVRYVGPTSAVVTHVQPAASRTMPNVTRRSDHGCARNWLRTEPIASVMYGIHANARSYRRSHFVWALRSSALVALAAAVRLTVDPSGGTARRAGPHPRRTRP